MMKSSEIRQAFLDFFAAKGHQIVPSSSLIPGNDPTLLFTNAGMVQFKDTFLGTEKRNYTRAVSAQRCLRAGGKHNDLENVGYTARHHTFFEMLGNFSFGDYFKREAIAFAWEFLTRVLQLPEEKLWVTVFKDDDETAAIWLDEMGVSPTRFSRCGEKDNFWSMGDTGPCGPCTEIFYDHGPDIPGGPPGSPEEDGDRYIEVWNLVFMQFNRDKEGVLHLLPKPSVDTGMGLERISAVVQHVHNNYEIDSFQHLIKAIAAKVPEVPLTHTSLKVIADHIRAASFLIADGILPGNEGRGYVLRRIIRRALRHGNTLGMPHPFFAELIQPLIEAMGQSWPELAEQALVIQEVLALEEAQFAKTLEQGLRLLQEAIGSLEKSVIPGELAFKLYDTYGFPIDLTADIAREQDLQIDMDGFQNCMQKQRAQSQAASQFQIDYNQTLQLTQQTEFHGYEKDSLQAHITGLLLDGKVVEKLTTGMQAAVILDHTPFYAESGGQVGDRGVFLAPGVRFIIEDTRSSGDAIVHYGVLMEGELALHQSIEAKVDFKRRDAIRLNHTATHLLHAALKKLIGAHVQQKGSLVDADRARFDFSHYEALTPEQIQWVEALVNEKIRENIQVRTDIMALEDAKKSGAMALFGEKYTESVRVLSMGDFSMELCGGTHARKTGDIGLFKITAEYGVASGVRRIEMVTGEHALKWVNEQLAVLNQVAATLKTTPAQILDRFAQILQDMKAQEKEMGRLQNQLIKNTSANLQSDVQQVGDIALLIKELDTMDMATLRATLDQLKSRMQQAVIILYAKQADKINVIAGISKELAGKVPAAPILVRHICGKGGGRDDMAQGGADLPADLDQRLMTVKDLLVS